MKRFSGSAVARWLGLVFRGRLNIMRMCTCFSSSASGKFDVLCDQILDSIIVAGITGVSSFIYAGQDAGLKAAGLSFLLTFLVKMKEYRKIS